MTTIHVPGTPEEVDTAISAQAELAHATGWTLAAFIWLRCDEPKRGGDRSKGENPALLTVGQLAGLHYRGLKDRGTVSTYWHRADTAIQAGLMQEPIYGKDFDIPEIDWEAFGASYDKTVKGVVAAVEEIATESDRKIRPADRKKAVAEILRVGSIDDEFAAITGIGTVGKAPAEPTPSLDLETLDPAAVVDAIEKADDAVKSRFRSELTKRVVGKMLKDTRTRTAERTAKIAATRAEKKIEKELEADRTPEEQAEHDRLEAEALALDAKLDEAERVEKQIGLRASSLHTATQSVDMTDALIAEVGLEKFLSSMARVYTADEGYTGDPVSVSGIMNDFFSAVDRLRARLHPVE